MLKQADTGELTIKSKCQLGLCLMQESSKGTGARELLMVMCGWTWQCPQPSHVYLHRISKGQHGVIGNQQELGMPGDVSGQATGIRAGSPKIRVK